MRWPLYSNKHKIQLKNVSIERETFPGMAKDGELYSFTMEGMWMDIGIPSDFLQGTSLYLERLAKLNQKELAEGPNIIGHVLLVMKYKTLLKIC